MNILIVEDDIMLRKWLSMLLSGLADRRLQIFEAGDGAEALELCAGHAVDLVITDIKMPRMDGLQLIRSLKESFPAVRTAVLSSYDEFSFVKTALQCGALDYILKAEMTVQDLSKLLDKVQSDVHMEHLLTKGIFPDYHTILEDQQTLADFLAGGGSDSALLESLRLPADAPAAAVLLVHLADQRDVDIPIFEAADICGKAIASEKLRGAAVPYRGENCMLLYGCTDSVAEYQRMEAVKLISLVDHNFQKYLNLPIAFSLHRFYRPGETSLRSLIGEMYRTLSCQQYYGGSVKCVDALADFGGWKRKIQKSLEANQNQEAAALLQQYLSQAHQKRLAPDALRANLLVLVNLFAASHTQAKGRSAPDEDLHVQMVDIAHAETREAAESLTDVFLRTFLLTLNEKSMELSPAVRSALAYVDAHYADRISLDAVAEQVFMNRSYFCQLFKRETGFTFGDYVEHVRIERAKMLLSTTNLPILSIAEQTGFHNQAYFTKVFKKAADISPMRYRKLHFQDACPP